MPTFGDLKNLIYWLICFFSFRRTYINGLAIVMCIDSLVLTKKIKHCSLKNSHVLPSQQDLHALLDSAGKRVLPTGKLQSTTSAPIAWLKGFSFLMLILICWQIADIC